GCPRLTRTASRRRYSTLPGARCRWRAARSRTSWSPSASGVEQADEDAVSFGLYDGDGGGGGGAGGGRAGGGGADSPYDFLPVDSPGGRPPRAP
ncbi:hypothetical protein CJD44_36100, partial [Streptomyces sp. alain-838]